MRKLALGAATAALILAGGPAVNAQLFHPHPRTPPQQPSASDAAASCNQLKAMPNAPMTYDQCMQMMASQQTMQAAQNDPAGMRPGDEAMSCDQIKAEFMANGGMHVDQAQVAQARAAGTNFQTKNKQIQAEGTAMAARETVTNTVASAAAMTPFGGAAAAAAQAHNAAEQAAFSAHAQSVLTPAEQQMMGANATMIGGISNQMQANPRQARLMSLAEHKNCH